MTTLRNQLTSEFDLFVCSELVPEQAWLAAGLVPPAVTDITVGDLSMGLAEAFLLAIPEPKSDQGKAFISSVRLALQGAWAAGGYDPPVGVYVWPQIKPEPPRPPKPTLRWGEGKKVVRYDPNKKEER